MKGPIASMGRGQPPASYEIRLGDIRLEKYMRRTVPNRSASALCRPWQHGGQHAILQHEVMNERSRRVQACQPHDGVTQ